MSRPSERVDAGTGASWKQRSTTTPKNSWPICRHLGSGFTEIRERWKRTRRRSLRRLSWKLRRSFEKPTFASVKSRKRFSRPGCGNAKWQSQTGPRGREIALGLLSLRRGPAREPRIERRVARESRTKSGPGGEVRDRTLKWRQNSNISSWMRMDVSGSLAQTFASSRW